MRNEENVSEEQMRQEVKKLDTTVLWSTFAIGLLLGLALGFIWTWFNLGLIREAINGKEL